MFDVRRAIPVFALIAFATHAGAAQDLNKIGARLVAADRAYNAAHDSLQALATAERDRKLPYDSIVAGSLMLRYTAKDFSPSEQAIFQHGAGAAWKQMQDALGDAADRIARRTPIAIGQRTWHNALAQQIIEFSIPGAEARSHSFSAPVSETQADDAIIDLIGSVASADEPPGLEHFSGAWIPAAGLGDRQWNTAAIDLATSNSAVTRDCYAGSIPRCKSALGLTEVADPLVEWYSPADWRVMVSGIRKTPGELPGRRASIDACLAGDAPKECEWLMRERPIPRPLDMEARHTLVAFALEVGGPKAYDRLTSATGGASELLAATSGVGIDTLVARWRAQVLAATPANVRPRVLEATSMIVWILLFAFVAQRKRP
jgi:hypothetical protein